MSEPRDPRRGAARVGGVVDLRDIRLVGIEATLHELRVSPSYTVDLQEPQISWGHDGTILHYEVEGALTIATDTRDESDDASEDAEAADGANGDVPVLSATARFLVVYELPEDFEFDPDDADDFGQVSVLFSTYPYFRELLNSLTVRAGLPPLVLGTLRSPLDRPEPATSEPAEDTTDTDHRGR